VRLGSKLSQFWCGSYGIVLLLLFLHYTCDLLFSDYTIVKVLEKVFFVF
jgi:hypothetical protein